jgi:2-methylisocitrate lyase-like PEP mutase family enzyme
MTSVRTLLREAIAERAAPLAPGVYDGLSAALTAAAGFKIAYMSGAAVSVATGIPDIGLATQTELAQRVQLISGLLNIPLVADADTGFGDVTNVYRTVQVYERSGAAAIQLEDQEFPKKCGHLDEKRVIDAQEFAAKIEAAVEARTDPDTVIIARTDSRASLGFDEAVRRISLYVDAGADMAFLEAPQTLEEIRLVPSLTAAPVLFNLVPGGKTPAVELAELRELGYALVILPGLNLNSAVAAMRASLSRASLGDVSSDGPAPHAVFDSVGLPFWEDLRRRYDREAASA